jgi:membrane protein
MTSGRIKPLRRVGQLLGCAATHWSQDDGSTAGAALAFFCAFSLAPLLVILLMLSGLIVDAQTAAGQIQSQLEALFGPATAKTLMEATRSAQSAQGVLSTAISVVSLLIGATTVLSALQTALAKIWGAAALVGGWKGWIRSRFLSLGFILTLGFLLLVSLTITTVLTKLQQRLSDPSTDSLLGLAAVVDTIASFLIISLLFALIYRYMPATRTSWRAVLIGGAFTALLFDVGRWGIGLYLSHSTQASAFGAAASFAALLLWLYYTSQIFLFGAEFTACLAGAHTGKKNSHSPAHRR